MSIQYLGFQQPIHESSYTEIKAVVKKIVAEDTAFCNVDGLGEYILVNFEVSIEDIGIGDKIQFNGEIKADPFATRVELECSTTLYQEHLKMLLKS